MRAAARTSAVRSERCGDTARSNRSARRRDAIRRRPPIPRVAPRLSSTSRSSTSGWPASRDALSGRTRTAKRRGRSRCRSAAKSGVVRTTSPRKLVWGTSRLGPAGDSGEVLGLIDQHDRNVVLDRVAELACPTHQRVLCVRQDDVALALRAGENLEQLLVNRHRYRLLRGGAACAPPTYPQTQGNATRRPLRRLEEID